MTRILAAIYFIHRKPISLLKLRYLKWRCSSKCAKDHMQKMIDELRGMEVFK